ncbi:MAG: hypothetical protein E4H15_00065 [Syntrophobacterales bacterium]|nr:MAG: hypothetical protein E4H15_00065 [Syntrophobacterales bacterium]
MSKKHRIGLKDCGGCTPRYDRVQAVASIKRRLEDRAEVVSYEDPDVEGILVVTGCPTACVDLTHHVNATPFEGHPVWVVSGPEDVEEFIEKIKKLENSNGLERGIQK